MNKSHAFLEKSAELATLLGQGIRRDGRSFLVPSRTQPGVIYRVAWALDGRLICNCVAAWAGKYQCWHVKAIREEFDMTATDERLLPAVRVMPSESLLPTEHTYQAIERAAKLALSGAVALPKELNTSDKVAAVMLYGWELGLKPMTALQHLYIVHGRVQPSAQVMAGLLEARTDARIRVVESTDKKCTLRLVWPSRHIDETWSCDWAEVQRAGLDKDASSAWAKYPRDKLVWHTTKRILRIYAPDVINGLVGPVIGDELAEAEDDDLYNEGDGLDAYVDGFVVDTDTGEILDGATQQEVASGGVTAAATPPAHEEPETAAASQSPSPASPHQRIRNLMVDRAQTSDRRSLDAFMAHLGQDFPYAVKDGRFQIDALTPEDAAALLLVLEPAIE